MFEVTLDSECDAPRFEHFIMACEFITETLRLHGKPLPFENTFIAFFPHAIQLSCSDIWAHAYRSHNALVLRASSAASR